jgi:ATP-dependent Clp protease ATP-binding subunit ClpA
MSTLTSNFDDCCREALERAKRTLADDQRLDVPVLLDTLYFAAGLNQQPDLSPFASAFHEPEVRHESPRNARVDAGLKQVLEGLAGYAPVSPRILFGALVSSEPGRLMLLDRGLSAEQLAELTRITAPAPLNGTPPPVVDPRPERRKRVVRELGEFGTLLTDPDVRKAHPRTSNERLVRTLLRHLLTPRSRSVLLVGPPGIGKTSLLAGLAQTLLEKADLPSPLRDLELFDLSPHFPRTGPTGFGDGNPAQDLQRVRSFLFKLESIPGVVLVVDRFFALLGMLHRISLHQEVFDGFLHSLDGGAITCIGCLHPDELPKLTELDASLLRRFRILHLSPPSGDDLLAILEGRRRRLEEHFGIQVPAPLLPKAVTLTDEHLRERHQPEKTLRLLESACARAVMEQPPARQLTEAHVLQGLEDFVGPIILAGKPMPEEELRAGLKKHIIGQDEVIDGLARAVVAGRADNGWYLRVGPRGVFLFGGPTGVGKTETALQLARLLGDGREALVRVDCQNLQGSGSGWESNTLTWRLLGVAPGYRGHTPGCRDGLLVRVRDFPECVLLFDEFEKADATVGRLMLRILDEGKAQDSEGNDLDFRRCFVVLTTNAGVTYRDAERGNVVFSRAASQEPDRPEASKGDLQRDILSTGLGQEFLGRVQHVFLFQGLKPEAIREVVNRELIALRDFAQVRHKVLEWEPAVIDYLARQWQREHNLGARYLIGLVRMHILDQLNLAASLGELTDDVRRIRIMAVAEGTNLGRSTRRREGDTLVIELR